MNIKNCPKCDSNMIGTNGTSPEKDGDDVYQILWLECESCGFTGPIVEISEKMEEIVRNEHLKNMIDEWNLLKNIQS